MSVSHDASWPLIIPTAGNSPYPWRFSSLLAKPPIPAFVGWLELVSDEWNRTLFTQISPPFTILSCTSCAPDEDVQFRISVPRRLPTVCGPVSGICPDFPNQLAALHLRRRTFAVHIWDTTSIQSSVGSDHSCSFCVVLNHRRKNSKTDVRWYDRNIHAYPGTLWYWKSTQWLSSRLSSSDWAGWYWWHTLACVVSLQGYLMILSGPLTHVWLQFLHIILPTRMGWTHQMLSTLKPRTSVRPSWICSALGVLPQQAEGG
jgi:hypothetical protein